MNADRPLSRFSVPAATLLLTLWLVFLAAHSSTVHTLARHGGAVPTVHRPQPAPLPLPAHSQPRVTPTAVAAMNVPIPLSAADVDRERVTPVIKEGPTSVSLRSLVVPGMFLILLVVTLLVWPRVRSRRLQHGVQYGVLAFLLGAQLTGCGTSTASQSAQSPAAYANGAMNWIEAHSVFRNRVSWKVLRHRVATMTNRARTTAATYGGIIYALKQTRDGYGFLLTPSELAHAVDIGMRATYADRMVVDVRPNGPAARAGVHVGDIIESMNGSPPTRFEGLQDMRIPNVAKLTLLLRRAGRSALMEASIRGTPQSPGSQCNDEPYGHVVGGKHSVIGYINLSTSCQSTYTTVGQNLLRAEDRRGACGWIIDARQTSGGDIWNYLAAMGPILGNGRLGGFVYPGGKREPWAYRDGKVLWNGHVRDESQVQGTVYSARHAIPPIALLTSHVTNAAGELVAVALHGRPHTRIVGEPTHGFPVLSLSTPLSDGAALLVSGAFSFDRTGRTFKGPIAPDVHAETNWTRFASGSDPPMRTALRWLQTMPQCSRS